MTKQEAIDWLKAISATQKESIHKVSLLQRKEALHMAIEALEKQAGVERALERLEEKETELRKARHNLSFEMYINPKAHEKAKVLT